MLVFKPDVGRQLNLALAFAHQADAYLKFCDKLPFLETNLLRQLWYLTGYGGIMGDGAIDINACTVELFGGKDYCFDVYFTFLGQSAPAMIGGLIYHGPLTVEAAMDVNRITEHTGWSVNT